MGTLISHNGCSCGVMKEKGIELLPITASFVLSPGLLVSIAVLLGRTSVVSDLFGIPLSALADEKCEEHLCILCYLQYLRANMNGSYPISPCNTVCYLEPSPPNTQFSGEEQILLSHFKVFLNLQRKGNSFFFICWLTKLSRCCQKSETSLSDTLSPLNNL